MRENISQHWSRLQGTLFPFLKEELGPLTENHQKLATAIDFARADKIRDFRRSGIHIFPGSPPADYTSLARMTALKLNISLI